MTTCKSIILDWLPPGVAYWLRSLRGGLITYSGDYPSWDLARADSVGYDADLIFAKVLRATLAVKRGEVAYERDSVTFDQPDYVWPVFSGLMWAAARARGRLNVLDFGGSLGSTYFQHRRLLRYLPDLRWNIVEQAHYVASGNTQIADETLRFYPDICACLADNAPNVILLSSVLQYVPDPKGLLEELRIVGADILLIDRTPVAAIPTDRLLIQSVPETIYPASYPMWLFSESDLISRLQRDWSVVDRHLSLDGKAFSRDGLRFAFEGWILESL